MLTSILPGPKEQNPGQIQCFLRPIVSDLLRLWKHGIKVPTPSCPQGFIFLVQLSHLIIPISPGRLVHVVLVAVVCDKPAAHKIDGFASHSHRYFCTCCWITQADKDTPRAFTTDGK